MKFSTKSSLIPIVVKSKLSEIFLFKDFHIFAIENMSLLMEGYHHQLGHPNPSNGVIPPLYTHREVVDVGNMAVGWIQEEERTNTAVGNNFRDFENCDGGALLPRALFPSDDHDSSNSEANVVTMESMNVLVGRSLQELVQEATNSEMQHEQGEIGDDEDLHPDNLSKKRRSRFRFAGQFLYATREIYLLDDSLLPPDSTPELLGRVVQCPSKKNGNKYEIKWIRGRVEWFNAHRRRMGTNTRSSGFVDG